jgi:phosphatidylserine decarboxylase
VRGRRYGLIRFGSRVDLYFPEGIEVKAKLGDKTVAGETILGYMQ